jgi:hypothetical protein
MSAATLQVSLTPIALNGKLAIAACRSTFWLVSGLGSGAGRRRTGWAWRRLAAQSAARSRYTQGTNLRGRDK